MRQEMQRKFQFWHRNCPADNVVDGQADLEKCTCGLNGAINDCLASLNALRRADMEFVIGDGKDDSVHNYDAHLVKEIFRTEQIARMHQRLNQPKGDSNGK